MDIACHQDDDTGFPPKLREAIVLLLEAAPRGSDLVKDVVLAIQHRLCVACSVSALPELVLSLLQLPDVCQVELLGVSKSCAFKHAVRQIASTPPAQGIALSRAVESVHTPCNGNSSHSLKRTRHYFCLATIPQRIGCLDYRLPGCWDFTTV